MEPDGWFGSSSKPRRQTLHPFDRFRSICDPNRSVVNIKGNTEAHEFNRLGVESVAACPGLLTLSQEEARFCHRLRTHRDLFRER
jgi:hypothetical protein